MVYDFIQIMLAPEKYLARCVNSRNCPLKKLALKCQKLPTSYQLINGPEHITESISKHVLNASFVAEKIALEEFDIFPKLMKLFDYNDSEGQGNLILGM